MTERTRRLIIWITLSLAILGVGCRPSNTPVTRHATRHYSELICYTIASDDGIDQIDTMRAHGHIVDFIPHTIDNDGDGNDVWVVDGVIAAHVQAEDEQVELCTYETEGRFDQQGGSPAND